MTSPLQGLLEMEAMRAGRADKVLRAEVKGMYLEDAKWCCGEQWRRGGEARRMEREEREREEVKLKPTSRATLCERFTAQKGRMRQ